MELTEQKKQEMIEALHPIIEAFKRIYDEVKEAFIKIWTNLKSSIEKYVKVKKCLNIYNRTKNNRVKKKQLSIVYKILKE